jgi:hypothetical protein
LVELHREQSARYRGQLPLFVDFLKNFIKVKIVDCWFLFLLGGMRLLLIALILFLGGHLSEIFGSLVKTGC